MHPKPTFLFIPGAWHTPSYFGDVMAGLRMHNIKSVAVSLPSVGTEPAVTSMDPDIDAIESALVSILDQGTDAVVVAHSYGGVCGSAAVGRVMKARGQSNAPGGTVVRLVYVAAFLPLQGDSQGAVWNAIPFQPPGETQFYDIEAPWVVLNEYASEALCHDVPEAEKSQWKQTTRNHALASLGTPVTDPAWRYVPTTYIYTTLDRPLYLQSQQWTVQRVKDAGVQQFGTAAFDGELGSFVLDAGHTPFLSKTSELVAIMMKLI